MRKYSLQMEIILAILIILLFFVYGCGGTRNTTKNETKRDSIAIENNYSMGSKIVLGNTFTYTPFDNLKPMVIDGKSYHNTVVKADRTATIEKRFNIKQKTNITKTITLQKTTDKTNYIYLWLGMFLIVAIAVWLWFYLPKLKTGI